MDFFTSLNSFFARQLGLELVVFITDCKIIDTFPNLMDMRAELNQTKYIIIYTDLLGEQLLTEVKALVKTVLLFPSLFRLGVLHTVLLYTCVSNPASSPLMNERVIITLLVFSVFFNIIYCLSACQCQITFFCSHNPSKKKITKF